ncbi:MAG: hypothetical protein K2J33_08565, partial [Alistipes sp.]|nr:hypothetical protein [Alistipes sp.]
RAMPRRENEDRKVNVFAKPSAVPNAVRAMPRRENEDRKVNVFAKPSAVPNAKLDRRLCKKRPLPAFREEVALHKP